MNPNLAIDRGRPPMLSWRIFFCISCVCWRGATAILATVCWEGSSLWPHSKVMQNGYQSPRGGPWHPRTGCFVIIFSGTPCSDNLLLYYDKPNHVFLHGDTLTRMWDIYIYIYVCVCACACMHVVVFGELDQTG